MLKIYCSTFTKLWSETSFSEKLHSLPKDMQFSIAKYGSKKERQLRVMGKLLLLQHLNEYKGDKKLNLEHIHYDSYNRPFVNVDFDFNIAHSGDFVICAAADHARVGVDIEHMQLPLDIDNLQSELTNEELSILATHPCPEEQFYKFWTRKEAILKLLGKGIFMPFNTINSIPATNTINGVTIHVLNSNNIANYAIAVASDQPMEQLAFEMINY